MNHAARKEAAVCLLKQVGAWLALVFLLFIVVVFFWVPMHAQERSNTYYAAQFPGSDVGAKITNAQAACLPNSSITCTIIIDAILSKWPQNSLPARCSQCIWIDYRGGLTLPMGISAPSPFAVIIGDDAAIHRAGINIIASGRTSGTNDASGTFDATLFELENGGVLGFRNGGIPNLIRSGISSLNSGEFDFGNGTAGDKSGTIEASLLVLKNEIMSSSPRMIWTLFLVGNANATSLMGELTPDRSILITRISARLFNASFSGCTVFPTFTVSDGFNTCTMTWTTSNVLDAVPTGSCSFSGGVQLIAQTNAGTGCTGSPSSASFFVQYRME